MKKIIYFIFILVIYQNNISSQDTSNIKYLPLNTGNKWVYDRQQYFIPGPGKDVSYVDSTFVSNNHRYFRLLNTMYLSNGTIYTYYFSVLRVDSLTGNIYSRDTSGGECLVDSLKSRLGDSAYSCLAWVPHEWFRCQDTNTYSIFGQNPKTKNFVMLNGFEASVDRRYGKNFGIVYKHSGAVMYHQFYYLKGCVINGILYGDTTLVGVNPAPAELPLDFSLSQNYPNPFNPITKIKFYIAKFCYVKLEVFDVLGQKITILVDSQLRPGIYETEMDGTIYSCGVYFYKLTAEDFSETKKMILIK